MSIDDSQSPHEEGVGVEILSCYSATWAVEFGALAHPRVEKLDVQPFTCLRLLKIYVEGR